MANVEQTIIDAADKLVKAVEVYGPKATSLVLETGRVAAMQDLARGFAFLCVLIGFCSVTLYCIRKAVKLPEYDDFIPLYVSFSVVFGVLSFLVFIATLVNLVDIFAWVGLQHPEIYLAAKLLKL